MPEDITPGDLPDWLVEMRDQQLEQPPGEEPAQEQAGFSAFDDRAGQPDIFDEGHRQLDPSSILEPQEQPDQPSMFEEPQEPLSQEDLLDGLRGQMTRPEEVVEEKPPLARVFSSLASWQRFVLSVLLFLNVALCGCMALVMARRVWPF